MLVKMNGTIIDTNSTSFLTPERKPTNTGIILVLLCTVSVCFNSVLIYCIVTNRKRAWTKKAKQLFYLVLSDLLVSIFMIPRTIFTQLPIPRKTYEICAALNFTVVTTQTISYYHVLSLCIHRYLMIRKVHLPSHVDSHLYGMESLVIWVTMIMTSVPPYVIWGRHGTVFTHCRFWFLFGLSDRPAVVYMLVLLCVPWILTNSIYVAMALKMLSTGRVQPVASTHIESYNLSQRDTAKTKTVVTASATEEQPSGPQGSYNLSQRDTANQPVATALAIQEQPSGPHGSYNLSQRDTANQPVATALAIQQQPSGPQRSYNLSQRDTANQTVATALATQEQPSGPQGSYNLSQHDTANQTVATASATQEQLSGPQAMSIRIRNRRVIKSIGYLLIAFNISILPLILIPSMMLRGAEDLLPGEIQALIFLNNISNPIIYTFAFPQLRDEVKRLLRRGLSRLQNIFSCENDS